LAGKIQALNIYNPQWTPTELSDWELIWSELWEAGIHWQWKECDYAWDHKSARISWAKILLDEAAVNPIPLPDTAVLIQLLAGVRQCDLNITDTAYYKLRQLVKSRCRVEVKLP
jgi:hypothetical protein